MHLLKASSKSVARDYKRKKHEVLPYSQASSQVSNEEVKEEPMDFEEPEGSQLGTASYVKQKRNRARPQFP